MTDLPKAIEEAKKIDGYVLFDFTGSDWCGPCIALEKDVLNTEKFAQYAKDKKLVTVVVDIPKRNPAKLAPEVLEANKKLLEKYQVKNFPTIMLMTPDGRVIGGFMGYHQKLDVYAELDKVIAEGDIVKGKLADAAKLEGVERAKILMEVYKARESRFREKNGLLIEEIYALTPNDELGFRKEQEYRQLIAKQQKEAMNYVNSAYGDRGKRHLNIDELIAKDCYEDEVNAQLYYMKADLLFNYAESMKDLLAAKELYLKAVKLVPVGNEMLPAQIEEIFAKPDELLDRSKRRTFVPRMVAQ